MNTQYNHKQHEKNIYQLWEESNSFNPDSNPKPSDDRFCIIMPPPNANDPLHIGHAMFVTIEDILIRYHRMLGDDTLWLPGTDHAGIETQFVFEKKLKKEGKSRFSFDRKTLYQKIWNYVQKNSDLSINQMKQLGASADWSRFSFMLDEPIIEMVLETFKKLHDKKLIYRDLKLVNFSPAAGTAYSDLEIKHEERNTPLYYIQYGPLVLATTRPETIFGDVAVAVHPDDKRYQKWINKEIKISNPVKTFLVKVVADDSVDMDFGTGAVKITPFHDHSDFAIWQRHKKGLRQPQQVIDFDGRMMEPAGKYTGMKVAQAREAVVGDMQSMNLIKKVDRDYRHTIALCYKTKSVIEPLPLSQFFIKVEPLVKPVIKALNSGEIKVYGAGHDKILKHWLTNLKDWNISRQVVWGIQMPVWYQIKNYEDQITVGYLDKDKSFVSKTLKEALKNTTLEKIINGLQTLRASRSVPYKVSQANPKKGDWIQETDTFDTWFSSSQWPVTALKNAQPGDFERFYPTQVMETGYDILPFWVMRMLMMGHFMTGKFPFKNIYLHGLIRDSKGNKMSKSKGNVVNPLQVTEKYGTDALRMALVIRSSMGLDKSIGEPDFKAGRNLTNKLWNAARFILLNLNEEGLQNEALKELDIQFKNKLDDVVGQITQQINQFQIGLAAETLYTEFWHWFCDQAIEQSKQQKISQKNIVAGLLVFLKLAHPFTPYVTEAVWQILQKEKLLKDSGLFEKELLITSPWPKA
jgi:valyl-tRNA synthetase